ncbi:enoyl-CoA hydratase-related protein [Flavisphingomonas formosensis]|uniref:enoyl-CoA hydratase-related protein n=1 Tax=Flavisphingomonas formosensis TaxID=861534 RepID=UPI001E45FD8B|nr:enoyl-CoA hydratase-related protein [Sphingomonas formosensis]
MEGRPVLDLQVEEDVALLMIDSPPVNALSHRVRIAIRDGLSQALADPRVAGVVLACAGRTFFAGADVTELNRPIEPPLLRDLMDRMEAADKPVIAALHGTALGGGLELALACHYRVAVPTAKVGLPEVALGLLPGAGGTQRVPRLVGVAAAVEMIGLGKPVGAADALRIGLIDAVVGETAMVAEAIAFARSRIGAPLRRVRDLATDLDRAGAQAVFADFRAAHPALFIGFKAADGVLRAIEAAVALPFDEGLDRERSISRELIASPESAAQRHLFFAERAARREGREAAEVLIVERLVRVASRSAETLVEAGVPREAVVALVPGLLAPSDGAGTPDAALEARLFAPLAAEIEALLAEGVAARASDIDVAMVRAARWPAWRGGPAFWAERQKAAG